MNILVNRPVKCYEAVLGQNYLLIIPPKSVNGDFSAVIDMHSRYLTAE